MKIIFFGTPEFAEVSLKTLLENNQDVVAVVTARDQMGGRGGKQLLQSPVKKCAVSQGIPVLQPEKLKDPIFINQLKSFNADLFIVVAFRMLPEVVWSLPPMGSYNLHGSLLPKYRGAAPIHWAVINGEKETGLTIFRLTHEIDTGDILLQEKLEIREHDTTGMVHDRMKVQGAAALLTAIDLIKKGTVLAKQNEGESSKAPKIFHSDCKIDFNQSTRQVYNFIRGMNPYPTPWTVLDGKECKILEADVIQEMFKGKPGTIITDQKKTLYVKTSDGAIDIKVLKISGSKAMLAHEYLSGHKILSLSVGNEIMEM